MKPFKHVRQNRPPRSAFNLSYTKLATADLGFLYPVMCDEVVPGDIWKIGNQMVIRFNPMVAPILHEINAYVHYFFVPYRLLWGPNTEIDEEGSWEEFITGGFDGEDDSVLPRWIPATPATECAIGSLWDWLGFEPGKANYAGAYPMDFPRRAYNMIVRDYYIDENITNMDTFSLLRTHLTTRSWEKDYFTSALPWQQRGIAPALPITGTTSAVWPAAMFEDGSLTGFEAPMVRTAVVGNTWRTASSGAHINLEDMMNANTVDLGVASTFDIADLRLAFQIQKWLERNARSGARYTEFLKAHFGVSPRDDRLQRPEYIGGSKSPIIVSEVLQTSETDGTAQGNLAGHGISVSDTFCGTYKATEYGLIMGLLSIMPKPMYQNGIDRQWLRETKYDFFFPEFVNLSEQAILNREIFVTDGNVETNEGIFGYQGRYDEMRVKRNQVVGLMRTDFDYWHLARQFATVPALNGSFIHTGGSTGPIRKDFLAAPSEPAMFIHFANIIKAIRPLPVIAEPGLIDHN